MASSRKNSIIEGYNYYKVVENDHHEAITIDESANSSPQIYTYINQVCDGLVQYANASMDSVDVLAHTSARIPQVFSNVWAHQSNDGSDALNHSPNNTPQKPDSSFHDNPFCSKHPSHSPFYHVFHEQGGAPVEWGVGIGVTFVAMGAGILIIYFKQRRSRSYTSWDRIIRRLEALKPEDERRSKAELKINYETDKEQIITRFNDLLNRKKVAPLQPYIIVDKPVVAIVAPLPMTKRAKVLHFMAKIPPFIGRVLNQTWTLIWSTSVVFWPIWMVAVIVLGTSIAAVAPFMAPIIISTISIGLGLNAAKLLGNVAAYFSKRKETPAQRAKREAIEKNHAHLAAELIQHDFIKQQYLSYKNQEGVSEYYAAKCEWKASQPIPPVIGTPSAYQVVNSDKQIQFNLNMENLPNSQPRVITKEQRKAILDSKFARYLLGSPTAYLATNVAMNVIGNFILAGIVIWVSAATAGLFPAAVAVTALLNSAIFGFAFCGSMGAIFGVKSFVETRKAQRAFADKVAARLSEPYKQERNANGLQKTKAEKFLELLHSVEAQQKQLASRQKEIIGKKYPADYTPLEKIMMNYQIDKIDVFNHDYFEKQREKVPFNTKVKKVLNRAYQILGGGQSGIFIARSIFLIGGIGAAIATGPIGMAVFFGAVIVLGITVAALRYARYCQERKQKQRENFVDHLDVRISYLKKENEKLSAALQPDKYAAKLREKNAAQRKASPSINIKSQKGALKCSSSHPNPNVRMDSKDDLPSIEPICKSK